MLKVSFICPIFNKKKYLPVVLPSIKNQVGDFEKEFIFINDGSNDGSLEYLKKITKNWKNVKIINQDNKGLQLQHKMESIFLRGLSKLVGGDDLMAPECTKFLLQIIKKQKSVAVFSRYKLLESFENIDFRIKEISNLRITTDPLYDAIRSKLFRNIT